jgi:hypothetical protein
MTKFSMILLFLAATVCAFCFFHYANAGPNDKNEMVEKSLARQLCDEGVQKRRVMLEIDCINLQMGENRIDRCTNSEVVLYVTETGTVGRFR